MGEKASEIFKKMKILKENCEGTKNSFEEELQELLRDVRSGKKEFSVLNKLLKKYNQHEFSLDQIDVKLAEFDPSVQRIEKFQQWIDLGVKFFGVSQDLPVFYEGICVVIDRQTWPLA